MTPAKASPDLYPGTARNTRTRAVKKFTHSADIESDFPSPPDSDVTPRKSANPQSPLGKEPIAGEADVTVIGNAVYAVTHHGKTPLSAMDLRKKYPGEATCHRKMLERVKANGATPDPRLHRFRDFLAHVPLKPTPTATLDRRFNDDRDYTLENIRWADKPTQTNNRGCTILLQPHDGGPPLTASQLAKRRGISVNAVHQARRRGRTDEEIISGKKHQATIVGSPQGLPPALSDPLEHVWLQAMWAAYPGEDFVLSRAERGMLRTFAKDCPDASEVMAYTIKNWSDFTHKVRFDHGRHPDSLPGRPDPAFLLKHLRCARNLYLKGNNLIIGGIYVFAPPRPTKECWPRRANNQAHNDWITRSDRSEPQPPLLSDAKVRAALYSEDEAPFLPDHELDNL
jgi:hypothetical protein